MSDARDLPPLVRESGAILHTRAERARVADQRSRNATHVSVRLFDSEWADALRYAPWSIDAHFFDADGDDVIEFHDSGQALVARLNLEEAAAARRLLGPLVTLSPLEEISRRRGQERIDRRRHTRARRLAAVRRILRRSRRG
ncbi:hypothetical protein [Cellulomonas marina]|uniref:hypothetical protein n=1 Tax=Cellulomonas marina TaxID=988821 RepID=UPI000B7C81A0|nr:hypothetical protein [Cellulomonas marina]GIG30275.1 hypothetical protein Cma02nite_28750 [Cellulomonas marina]